MNINPQISVIMPAYNAAKFISKSIESILSQTYKDFELIILNDASTDNTLEIIEKYAKDDPRIRVIKNKENLYIAANRNKGIKNATGKYIVWQDADDIAYPTRLEELYKFMEQNPKVGICGTYLEVFDETGQTHIREYLTSDKELRARIFRYSPVSQPAAIIRSECFKKVGDYNLDMPPAEDIEMSFRIGEHYEFANLPKALIKYRVHNNSATFKKLPTMEKNTLITRDKYKKHPAYDYSFTDRLYNFLQRLSFNLMPSKFRVHLFNFLRHNKII